MPPNHSDIIVVYITAPSQEVAHALARALVEEKLAACVNIIPGIQSVYHWEDAVHVDEELLLICKSRTERFDLLQNRVQALHPYDVPEIISIPVQNGSEPYLNWVRENTNAS